MEYYYPFKQYIFPQQHMMFANYQPSITYKFPFVPLDEVFVNIHNFLPEVKDCYYISNYGRVFNTSTNTFNSVHFNKDGYLMVSLAYDKNHKPENTVRKVKGMLVHRLVNMAFNSMPPDDRPYTNHNDSKRYNPYYKNLEWVTAQENVDHSFTYGFRYNGEHTSRAFHTNNQVRQLCEMMHSGIYDYNVLCQTVFGHAPDTPFIKLMYRIRNDNKWADISKDYNILPVPKREKFTDEQIRFICKYFQDHPDEVHKTMGVSKKIAKLLGYDVDSLSPKECKKLTDTINGIRNHSIYKDISSQYIF